MAYPRGRPRPPNSGRRAGTPNRLTRDVRDIVLGALEQAGGVDYLVGQAQENPTAFLALLGRCLPREVTAEVQQTISSREEAEALLRNVGLDPTELMSRLQ